MSFFSLSFVLLCAGTAYASGADHEPPFTLGMRVITAAAVVYIIYRFAGKSIAGAFFGRREGIQKELDDLELRKEKAREDLMAVEKRIANLDRERAAVLAEYEARGEALKNEIIARAESEAAKIMSQAKQTAQNEIDNALADMREDLANRIVAEASQSIAQSLTAKDQEKLINNVLDKVVLQ